MMQNSCLWCDHWEWCSSGDVIECWIAAAVMVCEMLSMVSCARYPWCVWWFEKMNISVLVVQLVVCPGPIASSLPTIVGRARMPGRSVCSIRFFGIRGNEIEWWQPDDVHRANRSMRETKEKIFFFRMQIWERARAVSEPYPVSLKRSKFWIIDRPRCCQEIVVETYTVPLKYNRLPIDRCCCRSVSNAIKPIKFVNCG